MENELLELDNEALVVRIEQAAREGAKEGVKESKLRRGGGVSLRYVIPALLIVFLIGLAIPKVRTMVEAKNQLEQVEPVEDRDLTLDNDGILGYTAADFAEAMLGDSSLMKKLVVYEIEVSDVATITDTGLLNLSIFSKCQLITYHGAATYTVDLSQLTGRSIEFDRDNRLVTLKIPHAAMERIHIPRESIEYGDLQKGMLAFGELTTTAEEFNQVEALAVAKMEERLEAGKTAENADRFARMAVWEIFQPLVTSVSPDCRLDVVFA